MEHIDWIKTAEEFTPHPNTVTPIDPQSFPDKTHRDLTLLESQTYKEPHLEEEIKGQPEEEDESRRLRYSDYVEVGLDEIKLEEKKESPMKHVQLSRSEIMEEEFKEAGGDEGA